LGRIVALVGGVAALVLTAAAVAVGCDVGRWGCKSQAELERSRPRDEVVAAFADAGFHLEPVPPPGAVVGDDPRYRRASAYRYDSERATFWILVCRTRCPDAPRGLDRPRVVDGRQLRLFAALGNNIGFFTADNDRRSGRQLQGRVQHVLNDLDSAEDPDSRCYIQ
jgi:hypothetical protein